MDDAQIGSYIRYLRNVENWHLRVISVGVWITYILYNNGSNDENDNINDNNNYKLVFSDLIGQLLC